MIRPAITGGSTRILVALDEDGIDHLRTCLDAIDPRIDADTPDGVLVDPGDPAPVAEAIGVQPITAPGRIGGVAPALQIRYQTED